MYASTGEILSERGGVLNLGLEGVMLVGAIAAYSTAYRTHSLALAILAALIAGLFVGLLFAFMVITLQANQVVCGLALVTLGEGLSGFIGKSVAGTSLPCSFGKLPIPLLSKIPFFGEIFFNQNIMVYALYLLVPVIYFYIFRTGFGLKLRATGENPAAMDAAGINVFLIRYMHTTVGTGITAIGGAYMTLAFTPTWMDNITAGNGWIAAALVIFSFWNPLLAVLGSVLFGVINVFALRLQLSGVAIPSFFISMLPYICTIAVLMFSSLRAGRRLTQAPGALGTYYDREAR
jgi:ABC-type uncharacterized transport system permease subunit